MIRNLGNLPRHVLISSGVILGALLLFAILVPVLGGARDDSFSENSRLQGEISRVRTALNQSKTDQDYVKNNVEAYESLLKSDRLVPHTRRVAVVELESAARTFGLTALNYSFSAAAANSLAVATSQPASGAYAVSIEAVSLKVGAPLDGPIYRFVVSIADRFPGAAVVQRMQLARAEGAAATGGAVQGEVTLSWRTAQAQEKKP